MSGKDQGEGDNVAGSPTEFRFDQSPVRAVVQDGEPWFVAKDVCDILDIDDPSMAVRRLDDDQRGKANVRTTWRPARNAHRERVRRLQPHLHQPEAGGQALPKLGDERGPARNPQDRRIPSSRAEFEALSGEYVDYKHWLLERALLDAKLIALSMQAVGSHFSRMVTDHPKHGEARSVRRDFADFEREAPPERPSIEGVHKSPPARLLLQPRPETCRTLRAHTIPPRHLNLFRRRRGD